MSNHEVRTYTLRLGDLDRYGRIRPAAVLELFQDVAFYHSRTLHMDFAEMRQRGKLWALVRVAYRVLRQPEPAETLTVDTWIAPPTRLGMRREYAVRDEAGSSVIEGASEWVLLDAATRTLIQMEPVPAEQCDGTRLLPTLRRVPPFEPTEPVGTVCPGFTMLDANGHVNNVHYVEFALDALSPSKEQAVCFCQVDFRLEVQQGTELAIHARRDGEEALVSGQDAAGAVRFACRLQFA